MADECPRLVDETATVARETHPLRHRVEISERIDTIPTRCSHDVSFAVAARPDIVANT